MWFRTQTNHLEVVCVCLCVNVRKAVHLELVSDLTCLRRFIARRGKSTSIWSDHGTNFVGANRVLKELHALILSPNTNQTIHEFCSTQGIDWHFITERLWEAAVKSHLTKVVGNSKLDFEEMCTVLEACLNSRPVPHNDDEGIEMLTPGHFLIGRPIPTSERSPKMVFVPKSCSSLLEK